MTTTAEAIQSIMARFHAVWDPKPYQFEDVPKSAALEAVLRTESAPWARVQIKHNIATQLTLAGPSNRKFENQGILIVEIYTPSGGGLVQARALAVEVKQAYEGVSELNGVWYRNTRFNELPASGHFSHCNVISEFSYDEVR